MRHEKPELSEKNPYHLSRHRYYELKHFCFQYPEWKKNIALASGWEAHGDDIGGIVRGNIPSNPTERCALIRAYYSQRIELIDSCIADRRCTITSIANSSGFSAGSVHDAKNSAAFMKGGMLTCLT